jgi:hypothetical protein
MRIRRERIGIFMDYLKTLEQLMLEKSSADVAHLHLIEGISEDVLGDADRALSQTIRYHSE